MFKFNFTLKALITLLLFAVTNFTYGGNNKVANSTFKYAGDQGSVPNTCLYKVNNETRKEYSKDLYEFGYNKKGENGSFEMFLAPGKHTFEIVLNNKGVTSKADSIIAKRVTINMKKGCTYEMEKYGYDIKIKGLKKNKEVKTNYSVEKIPVYQEPQDTFATIVYTPAPKSSTHPYISRIDDMVTAGSGDIFGLFEYNKPFDYKYFNEANGELRLKVKPGKHKIEYLILGARIIDGIIHTENFTFIEGKTYMITLGGTYTDGNVKFKLKFNEIK